jgi:hypothetical protein
MKTRWGYFIPVCALLYQPIPVWCLYKLVSMGYKTHELAPAGVWNLSMLVLALSGVVGVTLGIWGTYRLLTGKERLLSAIPFMFVYVPATVAGASYLAAFLVLLAVI